MPRFRRLHAADIAAYYAYDTPLLLPCAMRRHAAIYATLLLSAGAFDMMRGALLML